MQPVAFGDIDPNPTHRSDSEAHSLLSRHFITVVAAASLVFIGFGATIPLLPRFVTDELGGGAVAIGLIFGIISVSAVAIRPLAGGWGDRLGRRWLMVTGAGITAVAIAGHALAPTVAALVPFRLLMGAGQGLFFVGAATLANDLAPRERRGEATSYFSIAVYGGLGIGPVLSEQVLRPMGFTTAWLLAAAAVGAGGLVALGVPARVGVPQRLTDQPPRHGLDRLVHRAGLGPGLVLLLGVMPYAAFAAFLPGRAGQLGLDDAGTFFAVYSACVLVVRILGAKLPDKVGVQIAAPLALVLIAAGMGLIAVLDTSIGAHIGTAVYAFGMSLLYPSLFAEAVNRVDDDERARVVATFTMFFDISNGIGGLVMGAAAALTSESGTFAVGAVMALAGLGAMRIVIPPNGRPARERRSLVGASVAADT